MDLKNDGDDIADADDDDDGDDDDGFDAMCQEIANCVKHHKSRNPMSHRANETVKFDIGTVMSETITMMTDDDMFFSVAM